MAAYNYLAGATKLRLQRQGSRRSNFTEPRKRCKAHHSFLWPGHQQQRSAAKAEQENPGVFTLMHLKCVQAGKGVKTRREKEGD